MACDLEQAQRWARAGLTVKAKGSKAAAAVVQAAAELPLPPREAFELFAHPDNAGAGWRGPPRAHCPQPAAPRPARPPCARPRSPRALPGPRQPPAFVASPVQPSSAASSAAPSAKCSGPRPTAGAPTAGKRWRSKMSRVRGARARAWVWAPPRRAAAGGRRAAVSSSRRAACCAARALPLAPRMS